MKTEKDKTTGYFKLSKVTASNRCKRCWKKTNICNMCAAEFYYGEHVYCNKKKHGHLCVDCPEEFEDGNLNTLHMMGIIIKEGE